MKYSSPLTMDWINFILSVILVTINMTSGVAQQNASHPIYFYPNFPPITQLQADGACVVPAEGEAISVYFTVPDDLGFAFFLPHTEYEYICEDNREPISEIVFELLYDENDNYSPPILNIGGKPVWLVIPGLVYKFYTDPMISDLCGGTTFCRCDLTSVCPAPIIGGTDYVINHFLREDDNDHLINSFDSSNPDDFSYFGVCAEGSENSIFELEIENEQLSEFLNAFQIRIKEDQDGANPNKYGLITDTETSANRLRVYYQHPKELPTGISESYIDYTLEIYTTESNQVIKEFPLRIFRTPVVMVHGLWGDDSAFQNMETDFISSGSYLKMLLFKACYRTTNNQSFAINAPVLPRAIGKLKDRLKKNKIACDKVNVVAHSMGGILSRLYLQSTSYKEDIFRLITINTPHAGSPIADLREDPDIPEEYRSFFDPHIGQYGAAIRDLTVLGSAIREDLNGSSINRNVVPSHVIFTTVNLTDLVPLPINSLLMLVPRAHIIFNALLWSTDFTLSTVIFNGEDHDLVVAESSQRGGLSIANSSGFTGIEHTVSKETSVVIAKTLMLLSEPYDSELFTSGGFAPPTLTYSTPSIFENPSTEAATLEIMTPTEGQVFTTDEVISIEVEGSENITEIFGTVSYSPEKAYISRQMGPIFSAELINDGISGERKINILAKTSTNRFVSKTITIFICANDILLNDQIINSNAYFASHSISATGQIQDESMVVFTAGNSIVLQPGFSVESGATFLANIEFCGNQSDHLIDHNGSNDLFEIVKVRSNPINGLRKNSISDKDVEISVFPNPVGTTIHLQYVLPKQAPVQIALYNHLGQQVRKIADDQLKDAGLHTAQLSTDGLPSDFYFIVLKNNTELTTKKLVILK